MNNSKKHSTLEYILIILGLFDTHFLAYLVGRDFARDPLILFYVLLGLTVVAFQQWFATSPKDPKPF